MAPSSGVSRDADEIGWKNQKGSRLGRQNEKKTVCPEHHASQGKIKSPSRVKEIRRLVGPDAFVGGYVLRAAGHVLIPAENRRNLP